MDQSDRLIRALYAIAQEEEWSQSRPLVQAQLCRQLGVPICAWLTFITDRPAGRGDFTVHPQGSAVSPAQLLSLAFGENGILTLRKDQALPGTNQSVAIRYRHYDNRLTSVICLGFNSGSVPPPETLRRVVSHMVEAAALALRQFIQRDERLSRLGRSSRGAAAVVDPGGLVYAASRDFRELIKKEFGEGADSCLPFPLPDEALGSSGAFTQGGLHFRTTRLTDHHYQLHMRRALPLDGLSPREQEIARALGAGRTFKTVARQCGIAVSTVANHASRIYRKLGVYRREDLVELIREAGRKTSAEKQKETTSG
jgi:DNA-binding CsgD family transcriptional regulator